MAKAYEVMTQSLATCSPDDSATHVASIMCERNIGDVLVMEDGKLQGIITDRDLAIHALANNNDPSHLPVRNLMSEKVITGYSDWSMGKVAKTMAKHQVRRLPIMDDGQVIGIISLGDIARYEHNRNLVSKSLKAISAAPAESKPNSAIHTGALIGLGMVALASTAIAMLTWNRSGRELSKQMADTRLYQSAQDAMIGARTRIDDAASSKTAKNIRRQIQTNMRDISAQLPRIEYKPPKRKVAWFR